MAITPSDFSKIWASNADTPEYTFSDANYQKGWDFVGNLPPTRAQWNAMQKSTDEKMKYVFDNFGAPLLANTVAEMTMQNRVYVYTGSETGYTAGHWYYWDGSAWADGGVYNSNTVQIDPTLTISGAAADAKVTGTRFGRMLSLRYSDANTISSGSDLNSYTTPGNYRVNNLTAANGISNMPEISAGRLIVMSATQEEVVVQIFIAVTNETNNIYKRIKRGASAPWGSWVKISTKADIDAEIKSVQTVLSYADSQATKVLSNGHLWEISAVPVENIHALEMDSGNVISESSTMLTFSDYIPCPPKLYITFPDESTYTRIYFYTKSGGAYTLSTNVINYRVNSNNRYNQFSLASFRNKVIDIPAGTYMRIFNGSAVKIYGWDGEPFGCHLRADTSVPTGTSEVRLPVGGDSGVTVPGNAKAVFSHGALIFNIYGVKADGTKTAIYESTNYGYMSYTLPRGYEYFRVRLSVGNGYSSPESNTPTGTDKAFSGDAKDYISCLCLVDTEDSQGVAYQIKKRAELINSIAWSPVADVQATSTATVKYRTGVVYNGIPYSAHWDGCEFVGWFVSKHTFLNAVNDADSIFYNEHDAMGRPGYGTVCSAFSTLAAGFPYPLTNEGMGINPDVQRIKYNQPIFGVVFTDLVGHCLLAVGAEHNESWSSVITQEGIAPESGETMRYTFVPDSSMNVAWYDNNYDHLYSYVWGITHNEGVQPFPYDLEKGTITNGSARPYRGDRSVYTSDMDIRINIKDNTATVLYYEPFSYDPDTDTFTSIGEAQSIAINGATYIDIPTEALTDGTIYGVYTDANTVVEYFEYREVKQVTYHLTDDNIEFSNNAGEFWYCRCPSRFPYKTDGDYSVYRSAFNSWSINCTIFYKGIFGGYKMPLKKV